MRAVVCVPGGTEVTDQPDPSPAADGVVVQVEACGLCGSDVHAVEHGLAAPGQILGHEFSGRVVATGREVTRWREGQAVAVNPLGSCGACEACRRNLPFLCPNRPNLGLSAPGAYAEYVAAPERQLHALPDGLPTELGAHAEPLAVALAAVDLGDVHPGDSALVFGVGTIGLNVIAGLRLAGAGTIVAVGRSPGRRAAAAALGADVVLDGREVAVAAYAEEQGIRFRSAYECSGAADAMATTLGVLGPGGTSVIVGLGSAPERVEPRRLVGGGLRIAGSCAFAEATYARAVDLLVRGEVDLSGLISERVTLDGTPGALERLRRPGELVRVLVQPWR